MKTNKTVLPEGNGVNEDTVVEQKTVGAAHIGFDSEARWLYAENQAIEALLKGRPINEIMAPLCTLAEHLDQDLVSAVHLAGHHDAVLRFVAGPNVPQDYEAVFNKLSLRVSDRNSTTDFVIQELHDDQRYHRLARLFGNTSPVSMCSLAVRDRNRKVLGTATLYFPKVDSITPDRHARHQRFVESLSRLMYFQHQLQMRSDDVTRDARIGAVEELGLITGQVAHHFNNVLSGIVASAELIGIADQKNEHSEEVERICEAGITASRICRELLLIAGKGATDMQPVDMGKLVSDAMVAIANEVPENFNLTIHNDRGQVRGHGDIDLLHRVAISLLSGMIRSAGKVGGNVAVRIEQIHLDVTSGRSFHAAGNMESGPHIRLLFENDAYGVGVADFIDQLSSRSYDIHNQNGFGLGGIIGIIKQHRGGLRFDSRVGVNRIEVVIPASTEIAETVTHEKGQRQSKHRIFLVDDEDVVRESLKKLLTIMGCEVTVARNGNEAVRDFPDFADRIDVALIDQRMPGLGGTETGGLLREVNPRLPIIFISGYCDFSQEDNQQPVVDEITRTMEKPLRAERLLDEIASVVSSSRS